jgi:hypothetical protein
MHLTPLATLDGDFWRMLFLWPVRRSPFFVREIALILAINTAAPVTFLYLSSSMLALLREQVSGKDKTLSSKQRSLYHARCLLANPSRHLESPATAAAPWMPVLAHDLQNLDTVRT